MAPLTRSHNPVWVPLVFTLGSLGLLILFSSAQRPIWYDEMVTFTFAALPDIQSALKQVWATTTNLNQGTTGGYLLAEFVSVRTFGASWWAMRLPSLLAAAWALIAVYVFFRAQRVPGLLIALAPAFAIGYPTLWYFAGEARPYMPLVAGVLGVLAYYSLPQQSRRSLGGRALGWGSVAIGVAFHPYFLLYWPAIATLLYVIHGRNTHERPSIRGFFVFINPILATAGVAFGIAIASRTWLRGNISQPVPWDEWLGSPLAKEIITALFWPFVESGWLGLLSAVIMVGIIAQVAACGGWKEIWPPLALIALAIVLALVVTGVSILSDFWVFPRQWVASQAMVLVAIPWLIARVIRALPGRRVGGALALAGLLLVPTYVQVASWKVSELREWTTAARTLPFISADPRQLRAEMEAKGFPEEGTWNYFSQANLDQGGPIWPELGAYYTEADWSQMTLRRMNPSELFVDRDALRD